MFIDCNPIFIIPEGVETRWATAENPKGLKGKGGMADNGRKGSSHIENFKPGDRYIIAEATGISGIIRRIWITVMDNSPEMFRGIKLDFYWDGIDKPAISIPLSDRSHLRIKNF